MKNVKPLYIFQSMLAAYKHHTLHTHTPTMHPLKNQCSHEYTIHKQIIVCRHTHRHASVHAIALFPSSFSLLDKHNITCTKTHRFFHISLGTSQRPWQCLPLYSAHFINPFVSHFPNLPLSVWLIQSSTGAESTLKVENTTNDSRTFRQAEQGIRCQTVVVVDLRRIVFWGLWECG